MGTGAAALAPVAAVGAGLYFGAKAMYSVVGGAKDVASGNYARGAARIGPVLLLGAVGSG